jgi:hypothetical protein
VQGRFSGCLPKEKRGEDQSYLYVWESLQGVMDWFDGKIKKDKREECQG